MAVSVLTFGVSTERGTVHAVALTCPVGRDGAGAGKLPDRVVAHRTRTFDEAAELGSLVGVLLDELATEVGAGARIAGTAVAYRDPAQRRAIVTGLADGPWRDTSLVSTKSAHLGLARALVWAGDFEHLMICEVSPGYQVFTVASPDRDRVLATIGAACPVVTEAALRPVVIAARDQLEEAGLWPDAVMLVGSAAPEPAVAAALNAGFAAPVIRSRMAASAAAIGAALVVAPEPVAAAATEERGRASRGSTALFAAASVLAGGLVAGGVYQMSATTHGTPKPASADPQVAAETHHVLHPAPEPEQLPEVRQDGDQSAPTAVPAPGPAIGNSDTGTVTVDTSSLTWSPGRNTTATPTGWPASLQKEPAGADAVANAPGGASNADAMVPILLTEAEAPDASANTPLFPGDAVPPLNEAEFGRWLDNHWRTTMDWVLSTMPRT
ncbi:hypothetical protein [Nocardia aurantia]|uniref:DUF7159 domain-containing protein n=1 Tax=Nocardia aurantia TaxID=2585199 RepID=A0A7K0DTY4_9NOCA|nr:hypothetical protein [Nocardia aurantia]MQY28822.1 hypothetical protein [Nocardia aurantia]